MKIAAMIAAVMIAMAPAAVAEAQPSKPHNVTCSNETLTGTYKNVTVAKNASCTLDGATVLGNVKANRVYDVLVYDTEVAHNIMVRDSIGDVVVGTKGCKYDPHAGNNVMVKDSHNVLICWETVDNNIKVSGNDGKITVRNSAAGNNIMVTNNDSYTVYDTDTPTKHRKPGAIRVLDSTYDNHLMIKHNADRLVIDKRNTQS